MKKKQFSVEQIVAVLKQAELGMPVADPDPCVAQPARHQRGGGRLAAALRAAQSDDERHVAAPLSQRIQYEAMDTPRYLVIHRQHRTS